MRTPVIAVTGLDGESVELAALSLLWDLPRAVAVQHTIDPVAQVLTRLVSDASGQVERHEVLLNHACVTCALREDILPTILRLARTGTWDAIVVVLPVGAPADQLSAALSRDPHLARFLRLSSAVVVLDGSTVVEDLLGSDLVVERGIHHGPDDSRGVGEVGCAMVEAADVIVLTKAPDDPAGDLVHTLARPDAAVMTGVENLSGSMAVAARHSHLRTQAWAAPNPTEEVSTVTNGRAWRLVLSSSRPFHPDRLLEGIDRLGGGRYRTRGCFWLPTRAGDVLQWDGAGGQLSIGIWGAWGRTTPRTELVFTGVGKPPANLAQVFDELLVSDREAAMTRSFWRSLEDGFEPWLGPIENVA